MDGNGQRLQERSLFVGDKVRKPMNPVFRNHKIGGETSLPGAVLITDVLAEMILSPKAEITFPADDHRFNRHPVAYADFRPALSHFDHLAGNFVADGHRERSQGMFPLVEVEISSADAAGFDPQ
jgi:hypothetical protein